MTKFKRIYNKIQCPECHSTNTVSNGYQYSGYQRRKCKECGHRFKGKFNPSKVRDRPNKRRKSKRTKQIKKSKPKKKKTGKSRTSIPEPVKDSVSVKKVRPKPVKKPVHTKEQLSLDSVLDVPCYWCDVQQKDCVISCPFMEEFLGVNTIG